MWGNPNQVAGSALYYTFSIYGSLIPRLSRNVNMYRGKSLVSFLCKHDIIKIEPKHILRDVQPTMLQRLVCMIFDA